MFYPVYLTDTQIAFGGKAMEILPPVGDIPETFLRGNKWTKLVDHWFFKGINGLPMPKDGIDGDMAFDNLHACIRSFEPKHEHKIAGVAYLLTLWFSDMPEEKIKELLYK